MSACDVVIIGSGPYGLSAAAHLRTIKGLEVRVFGEPMSFWKGNMPAGMFLRSNWTATQIACPESRLTLEAFQRERGATFGLPVPLDRFVEYGEWYQAQAVPDLDSQRVRHIERKSNGFTLSLDGGETFDSHRVVVAAGIGAFARRPSLFQGLSAGLVTHTVDHSGFDGFRGKRVLIVGCGQSALESAALLREAGAEVEVVGRSTQIHWLQGWLSKTLHHRMGKLIRRLLYAPTDVGPAGISQILARPHLVRAMPKSLQEKLRKRATRPAGARWLVDRLRDVPIRLGTSVTEVAESGSGVRVRLEDGSVRTVDHILLGTGFHVDISKYDFWSPELVKQIGRVNGYPVLKDGLETSIPGLHILGAPAAWSFGPLLQFVSGTHFASRSLARCISRAKSSARRNTIA